MPSFYVLYYHVDAPELSEVYSKYETLDDAVKAMIRLAGYSVNSKGELTQFRNLSYDYPSMEYLENKCHRNLFLEDLDLYAIVNTFSE